MPAADRVHRITARNTAADGKEGELTRSVNVSPVQEELRRLLDERRKLEADRNCLGDLKCQRLIALAREIASVEAAAGDARI